MAERNERGGWDITDEEAAEVLRASGDTSCPPTREVDLLCTQLNKAEAERDAAKEEAANLRETADALLFAAENIGESYRLEVERRETAQLHCSAAESERDALRAAVDAALAIIDDWASDDTQIKLVTLPARIGAVLNRATAGVPQPTEVGASAVTSNSSPLVLGVPEPKPQPTKSAAELLREIAEADPEAHMRALARGYGVGPAFDAGPVVALPEPKEQQR